ncbi:hypothetical protein NL108_013575, partial [Boleophthalmus pectinirostris]
PPSPYSPFILVSNLRAHLYVALEKNAWLQKRIEELEEERNFLRCQLDRFIVNMRTQDGNSPGVALSCSSGQNPLYLTQLSNRRHFPMRTIKYTLPSLIISVFLYMLMAVVKQEYHLEEEKFYTEDEFVEEAEEEEEDSSVEKGSKKSRGRGSGEPRMKMRRIFRITHGRERQRVKDPDGVLIRYKKILTTYQRVRSMSRAFQIHGVDRNTMASTSPIAELLLVAPEK